MVDFTEVLQPERPEANLLESGSNAETHHIASNGLLKGYYGFFGDTAFCIIIRPKIPRCDSQLMFLLYSISIV